MENAILLSAYLLLIQGLSVPQKALDVAGRLISDTSFRLEEVPLQKPEFPVEGGQTVSVSVSENGWYTIGYSTQSRPAEIAYDCYEFENAISLHLDKGPAPLPQVLDSCSFFGFIDADGRQDIRANISVLEHGKDGRKTEYRLARNVDAAFTKHPYAEWHYANGAALSGLRYLAETCGEASFMEHIDNVIGWNLEHAELFRSQYMDGSPRTQNYRLFRCAMLDDSAAPALPYAEAAAKDGAPELRALVDSIAEYVLLRQYRLADGTFARPEPKWTVWCDDMFMGGAFLTRYYDLTGDRIFLDEACRQARLFYSHLADGDTGLLYHAWNDSESRHLGAHWGRANGWYLWAISDILVRLDQESGEFSTILGIHNSLLDAIAGYQSESGLWHQVLDHPETYEETSASCAFIFTTARAVRMGWLPSAFAEPALRGWDAVEGRIDENGVLSGICRSMSVQDDIASYNARETAGNDPRGLGMFFMAAAEISLLKDFLNL